jgi:parafibromin
MSNIKSFLNDGVYTPPDSGALAASSSILFISRTLPTIDAARAQRFVIVDSTEKFKPDYWSRVVAVFTTGQAWQFKGYKWQTPQELFNHVLGIYVGWSGEQAPDTVKNWGRGVANVYVEKWRGEGVGRWRDREAVEALWGRIEETMRRNGWGHGGPVPR